MDQLTIGFPWSKIITRKTLLFILPLLVTGTLLAHQFQAASSDGSLTVQILAGENLVVDSNVKSPSTAGPSVATVAARVCNPAGNLHAVNNVSTQITYPSTTATINGAGPYTYQLYPLGGTNDATRFIGTLAPGACSVQYWSFEYPRCAAADQTGQTTVPCPGEAVWGLPTIPTDDLSLGFNVTAQGIDANNGAPRTSSASHDLTLRNEISAMANKIKPNPDGEWYNTDPSALNPGDTVMTNGINYTFGNVNKGFDNDGDGFYDYNAWVQPFGDTGYNPACFRLLKTEGTLTVTRSSGNPPMVLNFVDQLYFTNLPSDNTNVTGRVYYTFMAIDGACISGMTPYQEAGSGADNEKFNADYGSGIPPLRSTEPLVTIGKNSSPDTLVNAGGAVTYFIPFQNIGTKDAGMFLISGGLNIISPLVIEDTVPTGMTYQCGSASANLSTTIRYWNGTTWSTNETILGCPTNPVSSGNIKIQWWLNSKLAPNASGEAQFTAYLPGSNPPVYIQNTACASFGTGVKFACADDGVLLQGNNTIGDFVWKDDNRNASQDDGPNSGIANLTVSLYYDANNNNLIEAGDILIDTQDTNASGGYSFANLANGSYIVKVDSADAPAGYSDGVDFLAVDVSGGQTYLGADFGFQPILSFDKQIIGSAYGGGEVLYRIVLTNNRPGDGNAPGPCVYTLWGGTATTGGGGSAWINYLNTQGGPNSSYATAPFAGNSETLFVNGFSSLALGTQNITKVEVVVPVQVVPSLAGALEAQIASGIIFSKDAATLTNGLIVYDVTSAQTVAAWKTDFTGGAAKQITLTAKKSGNPSGDLNADAVGYRITTDATCGNPNNTMNPVPLSDSFDTTKFDFVSADPEATTMIEGTGSISWNNVGPIYGGQTKVIEVRLKANQPADVDGDFEPDPINDAINENCAATTSGRLGDGKPVNNATDCISHLINPGGTIIGAVWNDADNARDKDITEPLFNDVTVDLYTCGADGVCENGDDVLFASTTTNASGAYSFAGLPDGSYYTKVRTASLPGGAAAWTNTKDFDNTYNSASGRLTINLNNGLATNDTVTNVDFGYYSSKPMIIGTIWNDRDNGGEAAKESGEPYLSNVLVYLQSGSCNPPPSGSNVCPTTVTDSNGYFFFANLANNSATNYTVGVYKLATGSPLSLGTWTDTYDSDGVVTQDLVAIAIPKDSNAVYGANFSYYNTGTATIGDTVYKDWNGDGVQNTNEPGIANVPVSLYLDNGNGLFDSSDILVASQTTNASGLYSFGSVQNGNYLVMVDTTYSGLANMNQTADPNETGTCSECDGHGSLPGVAANTTYNNQDFGFRPVGTASIGDLVWNDTDGDGIQDSGEAGLANISVSLYVDLDRDGIVDSNEPLAGTTLTDSTGGYAFNNLPAGTYMVDVNQFDSDLPSSGGFRYVLSTDDTPAGSPPAATDPAVANGPDNDALQVILANGQHYLEADFGFTAAGLIGDYIWKDTNGNGSQDSGEIGIANIAVLLYVDTNANGTYDAATDQRYFYDTDGSGTLSGSETYASAATDANGYYAFPNLPPQTYFVVIDGNQANLANYTLTGDPNSPTTPCKGSDCNGWTKVVLTGGQEDRSADFGYQPKGTIGDFVWQDLNADGVQGPYETGIGGVQVELQNGICIPGNNCPAATTDANGFYSFSGLANGNYTVAVINGINGYANTYDPDAGITGGAANPDAKTAFSVSGGNVTWTATDQSCSTACNNRLDFGYQLVSGNSVSGTFFFDAVGNGGPYTAGTDTPLGGVTVYLLKDGVVYASTPTDANGFYQFLHLPDDLTGPAYTISYFPTDPNLVPLQKDSEPDNLDCDAGGVPCDSRTNLGVLSGNTSTSNKNFGFFAISMDCGDLPDSYNYKTKLGVDGPCHINDGLGPKPSLYLGTLWDSDANGQPTLLADGDGSDEDGIAPVAFTDWTPGYTQAKILLSNVTGSNAYLAGWFDWNADGDFINPATGQYDRYEYQYFGNVSGFANHELPISIPSVAECAPTCFTNDAVHTLYVRFRLLRGNSPPPVILPTGFVTNGEVEDYEWTNAPTSVSLSSFNAAAAPHQIRVTWETAMELNTVGFNLYRATSLDSERSLLNHELIPGQGAGGMIGAAYEFNDTGVQESQRYYYWLEFIDTTGQKVFGPVEVVALGKLFYLPIITK